jgi:hypothetical protein
MFETKERIADDLRDKIRNLEKSLADAQSQLHNIEASCSHQWGEELYQPVVVAAHEQRRCEHNLGFERYMREKHGETVTVPEKRTDRWRKACRLCGLVVYTEKTQEVVKKVPQW